MPFDNLRNKLGRAPKMLPEDVESQQRLNEERIAQLEQQDLPLQEPEVDPISLLLNATTMGLAPAAMSAVEKGAKNLGRRQLAEKLRQERMALKDAEFVRAKGEMAKSNPQADPKLAQNLQTYKQTSPLKNDVNVVSGKEPQLVDQTPMQTISGSDYTKKIQDLLAKRRAKIQE